jgi:hypothetical protein
MRTPLCRAVRSAAFALVMAATLGTLLAPAGCARRPELCGLCQRPIHTEVRTVVEFADGRRVAACCPRCALRVAEGDRGGAANRPETARAGVRSISVTDHAGGGTLPIESAWLVDGSDETPCLRHHGPVTTGEGTSLHACYDRCMPSLIAFRDGGAARAFVAEHGGTLQPPATGP